MKKFQSTLIAIAILSALLGGLAGCSEDSTSYPVHPGYSQQSGLADSTQINILKIDSPQLKRLFSRDAEKEYTVRRQISAVSGGEIGIGSEEQALLELRFPENALHQDTEIEITWETDTTRHELLFSFSFSPHGIIFDKPVEVVFSYSGANLNGMDEDRLRVYYFNDDLGIWELIGGTVDKEAQTVSVKLNHFSRYAVVHG